MEIAAIPSGEKFWLINESGDEQMTINMIKYTLLLAVPYGKNDAVEENFQDFYIRTQFVIAGAFGMSLSSEQNRTTLQLKTTLKTNLEENFSTLRRFHVSYSFDFFDNCVYSLFFREMTPWVRLRSAMTACLYLVFLTTGNSRKNEILSSIASTMSQAVIVFWKLEEKSGVVNSFEVWENIVTDLLESFRKLHLTVFDKGPTEEDKKEQVRRNNNKGIHS